MKHAKLKKQVQIMVTCAMLIAIQIVLVRFISIQTPFQRISFGFLPLAMAGILFGPGYSCLVAAVADFLGAVLFPVGPFWPGFTIVTACSGLIYGLVLHEKPGANWSQRKRIFRIILAVAIINIFVHIGLGTLNLAIMYNKGFLVLLPGRIAKNLIMIPIESACISAMHMMLVQPMTRRGMVPGLR
ncbi:folate family ECF transporter S component [Lawsonibacter sp. LCP25S3_G6]|uniref:folate family ECF transporter S component n=1 Tax=unclassified Lawsonibacter TaxID=2617946 RepID=UPI003F95342D